MGTFCEQIQERHSSMAAIVMQFMNFLASIKNRDEAAKLIEDFLRGVPDL